MLTSHKGWHILPISAPQPAVRFAGVYENMNTKNINTKTQGLYEFFVYPEQGKFVGVCLTLDIVEEGENLQDVFNSLLKAAHGHVEMVIKSNLNDNLLNRPAPQAYWNKLQEFKKQKTLAEEKQKENIVSKLPASFYEHAHIDVPLELLSFSHHAQWLR